jgi:type I site-specific restriction endonuclease
MEVKQPTPEQQARAQIDQKLMLAGWVIQDKKRHKLGFTATPIKKHQLYRAKSRFHLFTKRPAHGMNT